MNKEIAKQIADEKLQEVMSGDKSDFIKRFVESRREFDSEHDFITKDGVEYQIKVSLFYDDKCNKEKKIVTACVSVDDGGFWSTFMPLSTSDFVNE